MRWIAPTERAAADQFRANSVLKRRNTPILGLIFLRFAEVRFMLRGDDHE